MAEIPDLSLVPVLVLVVVVVVNAMKSPVLD